MIFVHGTRNALQVLLVQIYMFFQSPAPVHSKRRTLWERFKHFWLADVVSNTSVGVTGPRTAQRNPQMRMELHASGAEAMYKQVATTMEPGLRAGISIVQVV